MNSRVISGARRRLTAFRTAIADRVGRRALTNQIAGLPDTRFAAVVAVPTCIHMADMSLRRLRGTWPTVCILNGVSAAEASYLTARHHTTAFCRVPLMMSHATVIDMLVAQRDHPFWLVDHDCLVLDQTILDRGEAESVGRIGAVYFAHINARTGFHKPQTFFMMLRPVIVRDIFARYSITSSTRSWDQLSAVSREVCASQGFAERVYPEEHKRFYDTLAVAAVIAHSEKKGFHSCATYRACFDPHDDVVHFGNTTRPEVEPGSRYKSLGAYFWRVAVERLESAELKARYQAAYPRIADLAALEAEVLRGNPDVDANLLRLIDRLCAESMRS